MLFKSALSKVLIHYPVISMCNEQTEKCSGALETGGILLGSMRGPHIEVLSFTLPGVKDESRMFEFIRQDPSHEKYALDAWKKSAEVVSFIGEWHTHPAGIPRPSGTDKNSWRMLVKGSGLPMVFIVIAPGKWCPYVLLPHFLKPKIVELRKIEDGKEGQVFE